MHDRIILVVLKDHLFPVYIESEFPERPSHKIGIRLGLQDQFPEIAGFGRLPQEDPAHDAPAHAGDHKSLRFAFSVGVKTVGQPQLHPVRHIIKFQIAARLFKRTLDHIHGNGPVYAAVHQKADRDVRVICTDIAEAVRLLFCVLKAFCIDHIGDRGKPLGQFYFRHKPLNPDNP